MLYTFDEIKDAVENCIIPDIPQKNNIFDIGTRGHYENPFTEVFSYILSPESQYKQRNDFTKYFLESIELQKEIIDSLLKDLKVQREVHTNEGRIDLLVYNDEHVLVFENKIEHSINKNDLSEYQEFIENNYRGSKHFFVMSPYGTSPKEKSWKDIIIGDSFKFIKKNITDECHDKWDFYVQDFLSHNIPLIPKSMDKNEFEFYEKNFSKIIAANNRVDQFINDVVNKVKKKLKDNLIKKESHNSSFGDKLSKAVRLYPLDNKADNVALVFRDDGGFSINIYYYTATFNSDFIKLHDHVGKDKYETWSEGSGSIRCFKTREEEIFQDVEEFSKECADQLLKMIDFYENIVKST